MGGHGGLNILPQKKWNVYNWDNRIKVMENEKLVNSEVDKIKKHKHDKIFKDKIHSIKQGEKFNSEMYKNFSEDFESNKDKNKIYMDIMNRQSLSKRIDTDLYFENRMNVMKKDEQLNLVENNLKSENQKIIKSDSEDEKNKFNYGKKNEIGQERTFKNSIKDNLQPWYLKKKKEDYIKSLTKIKKYFTKDDNEENEEEEEDNNKKKSKNYDEYYERLEYDVNNKITVKDVLHKSKVYENYEIDSDQLEFLKGERNLMNFLQKKRSPEIDKDNKDLEREKEEKKYEKKQKKHKKDKKDKKKNKKDKKHKKDKKEIK